MRACASSFRCRHEEIQSSDDCLANRRSSCLRRTARGLMEVFVKFDLVNSLYVFMLAGFIGFEVIRRVSPLLHTPLMSLTNALDAIAVVGAIVIAGEAKSTLTT